MRARLCLVVLTASIGLLPVAAYAQAADTSPKMTLEFRGMPAKKFVEIFAAKTGLPLTAAPNIANETILVNVKDLPRDTIMTQVADALEAKWERDVNQIRLTRTAEQTAARERRVRKYVFETIDQSLTKFRKDLAEEVRFTPERADILAREVEQYIRSVNPNSTKGGSRKRERQLEAQVPGQRAVQRVLASFKTEELANLPPGYKIVYSTRPNPIQRSFPSDVMPVIRQFLKDSDTWANAAKKRNFSPPDEWYSYLYRGLASMPEPFTDPVDRVMMFLIRSEDSPNLRVELTLVNGKGKRFGTVTTELRPLGQLEENDAISQTRPAKAGEAALELSPESQEHRKFLGWDESEETGEPTGKVLEWLLNPEKYDPLSFAATDVILSLRPLYCQNVITWVPNFFGYFSTVKTLNQLNEQITVYCNLTTARGIFSIRPKPRLIMGSKPVDRALIGKVMRRIKSGVPITVEEQANISYQKQDTNDWIFISYLLATRTSNDDESYSFEGRHAPLYGSLSAALRRKAFTAEGLLISEFTPEQRQMVEKQVFGPDPAHYEPSPQQAADPAFDREAYYDRDGVGNKATELFPTGLPGTVNLKCVEGIEEIIIPSFPQTDEESYFEPMTSDQFAAQLFYEERPDLFPSAAQTTGLKNGTFQVAKRRTVSITLTMKDNYLLSGQLDEKRFSVAKPVKYNQLPSDILAAIQKKLAQIREQYKDQKPGELKTPAQSTGGNIPPTR